MTQAVPVHFGLWAIEIDATYEHFVIRTTEAELDRIVTIIKAESIVHNMMAFRTFYHSAKRFTREELTAIYYENGKRWADWGDDAALFYAYRYVLLGREFPIVEIEESAVQTLEHRMSQQNDNKNNGI